MSSVHSRQLSVVRLMDVASAGMALALLSPLFAAVALLIRASDNGPVLFRQKRIGQNGKPFRILKFRSMRQSTGGPAITASGDSRVTPIGRWIRALKVDELPQLVNVLRGEMSLIGPRPEVPEYVELEDRIWRQVLEVPPGITDLASLAFRNEEEILRPASDPDAYYRSVILPEKLRLNLEYQRSRSLARDCRLLWLTLRYSFFPRGFDRDRIMQSFGAWNRVPTRGSTQ